MNKELNYLGLKWQFDGYSWVSNIDEFELWLEEKDDNLFHCVIVFYEKETNRQVVFPLPVKKTLSKAMVDTIETVEKLKNYNWPVGHKFLEQHMMKYPSLYETRDQALSHILLSYGNGMEWWNGRIVDTDMFDPYPCQQDVGVFEHMDKSTLDALMLLAKCETDKSKKVKFEKRIKKREKEIERVKSIKDGTYKIPEGFGDKNKELKLNYSKEYSRISIVPSNVTDDWLRLCITTIVLVKKRNKKVVDQAVADELIEKYQTKFADKFNNIYKELYNVLE